MKEVAKMQFHYKILKQKSNKIKSEKGHLSNEMKI